MKVFLAIVLIGQFTGLTHALADAYGGGEKEHCLPDCGDEAGRPCLPFCATCACAHGARPFVRAAAPAPTYVTLAAPERIAYEAPASPALDPNCIFHPPKR